MTIMLVVTLPNNLKTGNLGLGGGANAFFAGGIMNAISIIVIIFALFQYIRKKNVKTPTNMTAVVENDPSTQ